MRAGSQWRRTGLGVMLAAAAAAGAARGQDTPASAPAVVPAPPTASATAAEIALQRKLEMPFDLSLSKVELKEAFQQIAATAQISLQVDPACYDALPYGATTQISAEFRQSKLKTAIEVVLDPLSLQQTVSGSTVVIRPSGPLARIGRRADWDELKLLTELRTGADLKMSPGGEFDWTTALRGALDKRPNLVISFGGETGPSAVPRVVQDKAMEQVKRQMPLSPFRALELYCQLTNQVWFVEAGPLGGSGTGSGSSGTIRVMPMRLWIDRQLERPIQVAFTNAPLDQVVAELSHVSGIRFTPEPGLFRAVPAVSLTSNNCSVTQTLETLSGATRIAFEVRDDSILLHMAGNSPAVAPRQDPFVARIAVPVGTTGLSMDLLMRESDLTPEINEWRKRKLQEAMESLEQTMKVPVVPVVPVTPPAAFPSTRPSAKGG